MKTINRELKINLTSDIFEIKTYMINDDNTVDIFLKFDNEPFNDEMYYNDLITNINVYFKIQTDLNNLMKNEKNYKIKDIDVLDVEMDTKTLYNISDKLKEICENIINEIIEYEEIFDFSFEILKKEE